MVIALTKRIGSAPSLVDLLQHERLHDLALVCLPLERSRTHCVKVDCGVFSKVETDLA